MYIRIFSMCQKLIPILYVIRNQSPSDPTYDQRRAHPWGRVCICTPCFKTGGAYAPLVHMPPLKFEIVCFCPSWKKISGGADGADSKTPPVTSLLLIFSRPPKIHCYNPYLMTCRKETIFNKGVPCFYNTKFLFM